MIDYTLLTVISIIAFGMSICCAILSIELVKWSECVDEQLECLQRYTNTLDYKITKQRGDFNRSLLTAERKEKELDERMNLLQCRLNQDRMQGIIDGKITE